MIYYKNGKQRWIKRNWYQKFHVLLFDDLVRFLDRDIDFSDISLDEKLYKENNENILLHDISYKTSTGAKPLRIRFDEIDGFIKIHNKIRYLVWFDEWCDKIWDRIKYLKNEKITDSINHNFAIIKIDSYNSLPVDVVILIKSVVNKNKDENYYILRKRFV